jgi:hypothetical protein
VKWDADYLILTKKFVSDGYSLVVSGDSKGSIDLLAKTLPSALADLNLADTTVNFTVVAENSVSFRLVAQKNIEPYFLVSRFRLDYKKRKWFLKEYYDENRFW